MKKTPKQRREERKARRAAEAAAAAKALEAERAKAPVKQTRGDGTLYPRMHLMNSVQGCDECEKEVKILYLVEGRYVCEDCKIKLTGNNFRVDLIGRWKEKVSMAEQLKSLKLTNKTASELTNSFGDKIVRNGEGFTLFMNGKEVLKAKRINRLRKEVKRKRKLKERIEWTKS